MVWGGKSHLPQHWIYQCYRDGLLPGLLAGVFSTPPHQFNFRVTESLVCTQQKYFCSVTLESFSFYFIMSVLLHATIFKMKLTMGKDYDKFIVMRTLYTVYKQNKIFLTFTIYHVFMHFGSIVLPNCCWKGGQFPLPFLVLLRLF